LNQRSQSFQRNAGPPLDCPDGLAGDLRDLAIAQALKVVQDEHIAVALFEPEQSVLKRLFLLVPDKPRQGRLA
jgi:hypothetical protein